VRQIQDAGSRGAELTRRLLGFSRRQNITPAIIDLNAVIHGMDPLMRRLIDAHVKIDYQLVADLGPITADTTLIEQILLNLVVNARDAMPNGGLVTIETADVMLLPTETRAFPEVPAGQYRRLRVIDTGCGMDAATLARVFEPFFTTKAPGKGTGLGLATVYANVRQCRGHIVVDSALGRGTTFTLFFPPAAANPATSPLPKAGAPRLELPTGSETVLVAEDDDVVRSLCRHVLSSCGYTVLEAGDGEQALATASAHQGPIHLLLTDLVMPGTPAAAVAQRLAAQHPTARIACMSGYSNAERFLPAGVKPTRLLQKPFTPSALARMVRDALDN
jgi:CheY-like chemotaxis protein